MILIFISQMTKARFVMVARDPLNQGSAIINPLGASSEEEENIVKQGNINKIIRRQVQQECLFQNSPNETGKFYF